MLRRFAHVYGIAARRDQTCGTRGGGSLRGAYLLGRIQHGSIGSDGCGPALRSDNGMQLPGGEGSGGCLGSSNRKRAGLRGDFADIAPGPLRRAKDWENGRAPSSWRTTLGITSRNTSQKNCRFRRQAIPPSSLMLDQITPLILTYNERENIVRTLTPARVGSRDCTRRQFQHRRDPGAGAGNTSQRSRAAAKFRFVRGPMQFRLGANPITLGFFRWTRTTNWRGKLNRGNRGGWSLRPRFRGIRRALYIAFGAARCGAPFILPASSFTGVRPPDTKTMGTGIVCGCGMAACECFGLACVMTIASRSHRWLSSQDRYMLIEGPHLLASPLGSLKSQDRLRRRANLGARHSLHLPALWQKADI